MSLDKQVLTKWNPPVHLRDLPDWPHQSSGHLVEGHAAWRLQRPVIQMDACVACLQCYLMCPDAAIRIVDNSLEVELILCKGCGVCAQECKHGAIAMEQESK